MKLENKHIRVEVDPFGAVLKSIQKQNKEYLWQADPSIWAYGDHNLFPIVGRLHEGKYTLSGKEYNLPIHGFCIDRMFELAEQTEDSITFSLTDSAETRNMFPFKFRLLITYRLEGETLTKACRVENLDEKIMYFGIGSHPGFCLPADEADFASWKLRFKHPCKPTQVLVDMNTLMPNGKEQAFKMKDDQTIELSHDLFLDDALHLKDVCHEITLFSEKTDRSITVEYPDCPYLGLWQVPKDGADYICIEPWYNMPASSGERIDFSTKEDLISLQPGEAYENTLRITVH